MSSKVTNSLLARFGFFVIAPFALASCGSGSINTSPDASIPVAPSITIQPQSQTVTVGQMATLTVVAAGTEPLHYQWKRAATNVGTDSSSYTTSPTVLGDNGAIFSVVVSNTAGTITSSNATLTVSAAPVAPSITTQPRSQTVKVGQTATFTVTAAGTAPLHYQWKRDSTNVGTDASSNTTPPTVLGDSGAVFSVAVTNTVGSITSGNATLTVIPQDGPGSITISDLEIEAVTATSFSVKWTGDIEHTAFIEYGSTSEYGSFTATDIPSFFHNITVAGLSAATLYHFRIVGIEYGQGDYNGAVTNDIDRTVTTLSQAAYKNAVTAARGTGDLPKSFFLAPSPTGNDNNDGSMTTPFATLPKALGMLRAGDILYIMGGTYPAQTGSLPRSGVDIAPITITTYENEVATFAGNGSGTFLELSNRSYINVFGNGNIVLNDYGSVAGGEGAQDCIISGIKTAGLTADPGIGCSYDCKWVTIDDVDIDFSGGHGMGFFGFSGNSCNNPANANHYMTIKNSTVTGATHNGIDLHTNQHYYAIAHNTFQDNSNSWAIILHNKFDDHIVIYKNTFIHNTRAIGVFGSDYVCIDNNTIDQSFSTDGIQFLREGGQIANCTGEEYAGAHHIKMRNTSITNSAGNDILFTTFESSFSDMDSFSDIVFDGCLSAYNFETPAGQSGNMVIRNPKGSTVTVRVANEIPNFVFECTDGRQFTVNGGATSYSSYTIGAGNFTFRLSSP